MADTKIVFDQDVTDKINELVATTQLLTDTCNGIADRANDTIENKQDDEYPDYDVLYGHGHTMRVYTRSNHAKNSNARHNTLLRVVGGGGTRPHYVVDFGDGRTMTPGTTDTLGD